MNSKFSLFNLIVLMSVAVLSFFIGWYSKGCPEQEPEIIFAPDPNDTLKAMPFPDIDVIEGFEEYKDIRDASNANDPINLLSAYDIISLNALQTIIIRVGANQATDRLILRKGRNPDGSGNYSTFLFIVDSNGSVLGQENARFYNELQRCPHNCNAVLGSWDYGAPAPINGEESN